MARELVPELEELVRERAAYASVRARCSCSPSARSGRQADALEAYRSFRAQASSTRSSGSSRAPELMASSSRRSSRRTLALAAPRRVRPAPSRRRPSAALLLAGAAVLIAVAGGVTYRPSLGDLTRGRRLAALEPNSVGLIDPHTSRIVAQVPVGSRPESIALGAGSVWVANRDEATISRVDPGSRQVVRTISVPGEPTGAASDAQRLWVTTLDGDLLRLDAAFNVVGRRKALPGASGRLRAGHKAGSGRLRRPLGALAERSRVPVRPFRRAGDPDRCRRRARTRSPSERGASGSRTPMTSPFPGSITRVLVTATIPVGHGPAAVAAGDSGVWVANALDGTLVRIHPSTNAVSFTTCVGPEPSAVVLTPGAVWVCAGPWRIGGSTRSRIREGQQRDSHGWPARRPGRRPRWHLGGTGQGGPACRRRGRDARGSSTSRRSTSPLDPAVSQDVDTFNVLYATCAKLFNYPDRPGSAGTVAVPEVAESTPAVSPDGLAYTFRIRPGFRFSPPSTEAVTAASFVRAFERVLAPQMKSDRGASFVQDVAGAQAFAAGRADHISGVVARGNLLTIRLDGPLRRSDHEAGDAALLLCGTERIADRPEEGFPRSPVPVPTTLPLYTPGVQLVLRRNPNYHGPRPHRPSRIVFTFGIKQEDSARDVVAGRADFSADGFPAAEARRLQRLYGGPRKAGRPWIRLARARSSDSSF